MHSNEQMPKSEFWADVYSQWVSVERLSGYQDNKIDASALWSVLERRWTARFFEDIQPSNWQYRQPRI
jgi:hypothetical protein